MANAVGGFMAGSIVAKLLLDKTGFHTEMVKAQKETSKFAQDMTKVGKQIGSAFLSFGKIAAVTGIAAGAAIGAIVKKTADAGDAIHDLAERTGVSAKILSSYKLAADQAGTSLEGLATGFRGLSSRMMDAKNGLAESQRAFDTLGVSVMDSTGELRPMNDVLLDVAERFSKMENGATKAALAQDVFGRSGMDLIPMLNLGAEGLAETVKQAERLGIVFDDKAAAAADRFNDVMTELRSAFTGMRNDIGNALIPAFTKIGEAATEAFAFIRSKIAEFAQSGQLQEWAIATAKVFVSAFKIMVQAIELLMMAIPSIKAGLGKTLAWMQEAVAATADVFAKLPGALGAGYAVMAQMARNAAIDLRAAADEQIDKAAEIAAGFLPVLRALDLMSASLGKVTESTKRTVVPFREFVQLIATALPPAKEFNAAMGLWSVQLTESVLPAVNRTRQELVRLNLELMNQTPWDKFVMKATDAISKIQMAYQLFSTAITAVINQAQTNATIAVENEYKRRLVLIEKSLMSEEEKHEAMQALEAEYQIKRTEAQRKGAGATKAVALMGAIVNTAEAVTKALTVGPILGPILAGIIAALGAVQVALIAKQPIPLAEGATFDKPTLLQNVLVGEKRPEFLLDAPRLQEIVRSAFTAPAFSGAPAMAMAGAGGGGVVNMNFHAPLITTTGISRRDVDEASGLIFEAMDRETRRRGYRISGR